MAAAEDRESVVRTVVAAFAADPAWRWLLGSHDDALAPLFAGSLFDQRVGSGTCWVTDDCSSVAMWESPVGPADDVRRQAWAPFRARAGSAVLERVSSYDSVVHAVAPSEPFWYLGVLATHPDRHGRGGASRALEAALARVDAEGLPSCLETSTPGNRAFYERRGFTDAIEVPVPGGPATWWLTRPARTGRVPA